ncbi:MAG TPA: hypothetical protein VFY71_02400 [Planctomycetota bacterium]|nr:hypothetical protein [Planctomycetota bacterium]
MHRPESLEWFHVTHRGLGRRPVFPAAPEIRAFLGLVARESVRDGLEVHAFAVLTNHCHLLVRAERRPLSIALRRVFAAYSRQLNRRLRRDGPLFNGRARVRPIRSSAHWRATISYIDRNPVEAGLVARAARYPFGSAWHYARAAGPPWLTRIVLEDFVRRRAVAAAYAPADYARVFGDDELPGHSLAVVERRLWRSASPDDPLDDLLAAAPADVRKWLERMAREADGGAAAPCLVDPRTLMAERDLLRRKTGTWRLESGTLRDRSAELSLKRRGGLRRDGWSVVACGLLRTACGLSLDEIGQRVGLSVGGVHFQVRCHRRLMALDGQYRSRAASVLRAALQRDFPDGAPSPAPGSDWAH